MRERAKPFTVETRKSRSAKPVGRAPIAPPLSAAAIFTTSPAPIMTRVDNVPARPPRRAAE
jgi:hypothetical protein